MLQQQLEYHQHMQQQMKKKMDERLQRLKEMGYHGEGLDEEPRVYLTWMTSDTTQNVKRYSIYNSNGHDSLGGG